MKRGDHLPDFSDDIKKSWIVKRDECGDEYIALNGKNALGKGGLDHIYLISNNKADFWITGKQVGKKINNIQKRLPSIVIEQLGDGEAVLSVPICDLRKLCEVARAKKRKHLSEDQRQRLRDISPFIRSKKNIA